MCDWMRPSRAGVRTGSDGTVRTSRIKESVGSVGWVSCWSQLRAGFNFRQIAPLMKMSELRCYPRLIDKDGTVPEGWCSGHRNRRSSGSTSRPRRRYHQHHGESRWSRAFRRSWWTRPEHTSQPGIRHTRGDDGTQRTLTTESPPLEKSKLLSSDR